MQLDNLFGLGTLHRLIGFTIVVQPRFTRSKVASTNFKHASCISNIDLLGASDRRSTGPSFPVQVRGALVVRGAKRPGIDTHTNTHFGHPPEFVWPDMYMHSVIYIHTETVHTYIHTDTHTRAYTTQTNTLI